MEKDRGKPVKTDAKLRHDRETLLDFVAARDPSLRERLSAYFAPIDAFLGHYQTDVSPTKRKKRIRKRV